MVARTHPPVDSVAAQVVGIAMSAGGLQPLRRLLTRVSPSIPAAIVVVQHVGRSSELPKVLRHSIRLPVKFADAGERLCSGTIYVAPPEQHILINPDRTIGLTDAPRIRFQRPSADWFFRSMAASFEECGMAVVLSGALNDGARGIRFVHEVGGLVIAQDPQSCERSSMPLAAIATGMVDHVLVPDDIAAAMNSFVRRPDHRRAARAWEEPFVDPQFLSPTRFPPQDIVDGHRC